MFFNVTDLKLTLCPQFLEHLNTIVQNIRYNLKSKLNQLSQFYLLHIFQFPLC